MSTSVQQAEDITDCSGTDHFGDSVEGTAAVPAAAAAAGFAEHWASACVVVVVDCLLAACMVDVGDEDVGSLGNPDVEA